jgi:cation diffusion facilitator family transporter
MSKNLSEHYRVTRRVTLVGGVIDALLSALKISIGLIGHSQALIVDGVHSLSDLATDVLVIWAARHAKEAPDERHPYGHQRIETLATMLLAVVLIAIAMGFVYDAILRLLDSDNLQQPGSLVLMAAGLSMLAKEGIYHYTLRAAKKINSRLLRANAWHSRSDAVSSLIVFMGAIGAMLGFEYADAVASVGVALMIAWVGWVLGREGIEELIDTSVEPDILAQMRKSIAAVEGVIDVHQIRTRKMAGNIIMDTHITVNSRLTVSEGHRIGDAVEFALHQEFKDLSDITVHIDHEDDAFERPGYHLPLRSIVLANMSTALSTQKESLGDISMDDFSDIKLHYLEGSLQLEIWRTFPPEQTSIPEVDTESAIRTALMQTDYISGVQFVYSHFVAANQ